MFVSLLELALGAIVIGLCFGWLVLDNRWLSGRIDQLDDDHDRHARDTLDRLQRTEDWIKHLDERTRRMAGAVPAEPARFVVSGNTVHDTDPGQVPAVVPNVDDPTEEIDLAPATVPDGMPLAVQAALLEARELMTPETAEKQRAARAAFVEDQLARFNFSGGRK